MPAFIPGLQLAEHFWREVVAPLLAREFPELRYSAALIGPGSEVLGFDTALSTDHDWGPRLQLFLSPEAHARDAQALLAMLTAQLPRSFLGFSTDFGTGEDATGTLQHRVMLHTVRDFLQAYVAVDSERPLAPADWLTLPQQKLRAITAGAVFHDGLDLQAMRARFAWYPRDVWLYLLAAGWTRIGQEDHLMARAGLAGDDLGSALIGARLVRDLMQLCFLIERQYAPYAKWFGSAFARLACASELTPVLQRALAATTWPARLAHIVTACEGVARLQNALNLAPPVPVRVQPFFTRPFNVINSGDFVAALLAQIEAPDVRAIALTHLIGGIDQFSDSTDLREAARHRSALAGLFGA